MRDPAPGGLAVEGARTLVPSPPVPPSAYLRVRRARDAAVAPVAALLARRRVAPWAVSTTGVGVAGSTAWLLPEHPRLALGAAAVALGADALDGAVARHAGRASPRGKLFDHACDAATFLALALGAAAGGYAAPGLALAAGLACAAAVAGALTAAALRHPAAFAADPRAGAAAHLPKLPFFLAYPAALAAGPGSAGADWLGGALVLSAAWGAGTLLARAPALIASRPSQQLRYPAGGAGELDLGSRRTWERRAMSDTDTRERSVSELPVPLERDVFLRNLLRHLSGTLQDVVGTEEAAGFISVVGRELGEEIDRDYRAALGIDRLDREQLADVLVDLKRRIQGDFYVIEETEEKIVLGNRACPFGDKVRDRPALCMMTSNVFGSIAASNLGYGKVELEETIAQGHPGCRVVVYLKRSEESERAGGREYYRRDDEA